MVKTEKDNFLKFAYYNRAAEKSNNVLTSDPEAFN